MSDPPEIAHIPGYSQLFDSFLNSEFENSDLPLLAL